ncbi:MAG: DNA polymerase III subunit delta [Bacteroidales bacterium]|nr:DNA polymerase III subunit delta [Bacteroidales bacterium]
MLFKDIFGKDDVKKRLVSSVNENRVSHAQLFLGPEGSGKLALALAYAQFICCQNKKEDDACGECNSCKKYNKLEHPDLHFFFPTAVSKISKNAKPSSKIYIKEWRSFLLKNNTYICLNEWLSYIDIENKQATIYTDDCTDIIKVLNLKSYESEYKIIIIYMIEKLYHSAAPKLLKALEEPPEKTLFLIVSEQQDLILKTILSRVQLIKIHKHTDNEVASYLVEKAGADKLRAESISKISEGNIIEALRIFENEDEINFFTTNFQEWMRYCYKKDYSSIVTWVDNMSKASIGKERLKKFFIYALNNSRNCLLINFNSKDLVKVNEEDMEFLKKFHPFINAKNFESIHEELNKALLHIERNVSPKIVLMDLSFKIIKLLMLR